MSDKPDKNIVRIAAVGDIHVSKSAAGRLKSLFSEVNQAADVLLLCGDLTDYGLAEEAHILAKELSEVKIPILAVLGNHDYETGTPEEVIQILCEAGVQILDGDVTEIHGIGFAGIKGFAGGFGSATLGAWGEPAVKTFVQEAIKESQKLEAALARFRMEQRVVLMHYSPIKATVEGEPVEIFPFLGCSRLEEPFLRYPVSAIFHGHAHRGTPEGRTINNIPVYNVALPLLTRTYKDQPPFRLLELPVQAPAQELTLAEQLAGQHS